jgi:hypothetical protein
MLWRLVTCTLKTRPSSHSAGAPCSSAKRTQSPSLSPCGCSSTVLTTTRPSSSSATDCSSASLTGSPSASVAVKVSPRSEKRLPKTPRLLQLTKRTPAARAASLSASCVSSVWSTATTQV